MRFLVLQVELDPVEAVVVDVARFVNLYLLVCNRHRHAVAEVFDAVLAHDVDFLDVYLVGRVHVPVLLLGVDLLRDVLHLQLHELLDLRLECLLIEFVDRFKLTHEILNPKSQVVHGLLEQTSGSRVAHVFVVSCLLRN